MAMSRDLAGRSVTSRPSIRIRPALAVSSPASKRSRVDFPQPDGPTRTRNSPSLMERLMSRSTRTVPKLFSKPTMSSKMKMSRRQFAKGTVATAALAATGVLTRMPKVHAADPIELVHWSWLSASDAEVWTQMIQNFNDAHKDKGVQIKMETVPDDQYETKVLAAAASGQAPDF